MGPAAHPTHQSDQQQRQLLYWPNQHRHHHCSDRRWQHQDEQRQGHRRKGERCQQRRSDQVANQRIQGHRPEMQDLQGKGPEQRRHWHR